MSRNKLYLFILGFSFAGIAWILINHYFLDDISVCIFRSVTGMPCPSCGITGTIGSFFGNQTHFVNFNVLGIIILPCIIVFPVWVLWDLILGKDNFFRFFIKSEVIIRKKKVAIPLIIFVLLNWLIQIFIRINI